MTQLYKLTGQLIELQKLAESDSEIDIKDTLEALTGELQQKAEGIVSLALNMDADTDAIDAEIDRLKQRKQFIVNRQNGLKDYLRINMEASGIKKITCPLFTITYVDGRNTVSIDDLELIPDELVELKTEIIPNKVKIAAELTEGRPVPGASFKAGKASIRIK